MGKPSTSKGRQPRRRPPPAESGASGAFTTSDGAVLHFEDSGGPGPVLFYIYGLACSIRHWKYRLAYFGDGGGAKRGHRQIWMDFRGHGRSDPVRPGERLRVARI